MPSAQRSNVADYFQELGRAIESRWHARDFDEEVFAQLSAAALREMPAHEHVTSRDVLAWAASASLPRQLTDSSTFGQPPVTAFAGERFVVDVYYWFEGSTSIHEHSFCGAFQVLDGGSLHSAYRFDRRRRVNSRLLLGEVVPVTSETLRVGDVREILPGRAFAHALFHLGQPSVTVVVRTHANPEAAPQYEYWRPGVAIDPFFKPRARGVAAESLDALYRIDPGLYLSTLRGVIEGANLEETFHALLGHARRTTGVDDEMHSERFAGLLTAARERHGADVDVFARACEETMRKISLQMLRGHVTDADLRFFLAVLLNARGRRQALEFVASRHPGEAPVEKVMGWIRELAALRVDDTNALAADFSDGALEVLRLLVEGCAAGQMADRLVERGYPRDQVEAMGDDLTAFADEIRANEILRTLAED